jgi:hypothetical protein
MWQRRRGWDEKRTKSKRKWNANSADRRQQLKHRERAGTARWRALGFGGRACRPTAWNSRFCSADGDVGDVGGAGVRELTLVNLSGKVLGYAGR